MGKVFIIVETQNITSSELGRQINNDLKLDELYALDEDIEIFVVPSDEE